MSNQPPNPTKQRSPRSLWIILGICTVTVAVIGIWGFVSIRAILIKNQVLPPPVPVIADVRRDLGEGWLTVSIYAVPMTIDLPAPALPIPFEQARDENPLNVYTQYLAAFKAQGTETLVTIRVIWPTVAGTQNIRGAALADTCLDIAKGIDASAHFMNIPGATFTSPGSIGYRSVPSEPPLSTIQLFRETATCTVVIEVRSKSQSTSMATAERIMRSFRHGY